MGAHILWSVSLLVNVAVPVQAIKELTAQLVCVACIYYDYHNSIHG